VLLRGKTQTEEEAGELLPEKNCAPGGESEVLKGIDEFQ